jgi:type III secretory pathway component EscT
VSAQPLLGLSLDALPLSRVLGAGLLGFVRMLPLGLLAGTRAPWPVGLAIAAALALGLLPSALASAGELPEAPLALLALAPRELLLGALYALWLMVPLAGFTWAGRLSGAALQAPPAERSVGALYAALAAAAFFTLGGHRVALRALSLHLSREPLGQLALQQDLGHAALAVVALASEALLVAVTLALPVLAAALFADLMVALVARGSGSPLALSLLPLRPALLLLLLSASLTVALQLLPELLSAALARDMHGLPP